jgi:hypothetical protein
VQASFKAEHQSAKLHHDLQATQVKAQHEAKIRPSVKTNKYFPKFQ